MAVAKAQIRQLVGVIGRHCAPRALLDDLKATDAYRWNASFRETVDRCLLAPSEELDGRAKEGSAR